MRHSNRYPLVALLGFALSALAGIACSRPPPVGPDCSVDADGDGYNACLDCDDSDPTVHPGAPEICDGKVNDCDQRKEGAVADLNVTDAPPCENSLGVCAACKKECVNGAFVPCVADTYARCGVGYELLEKTCDGKDNDCDGTADNLKDPGAVPPQCSCSPVGAVEECYGGRYSNKGLCGKITRTCQLAGWSLCASDNGVLPSKAPKTESRCYLPSGTYPSGQSPASPDDDPNSVYCETTCDGNDDDCDGTSGEDFDLGSDPNNCSACGIKATPANAAPACVNGNKDRGPCAPGFFDLDGNRANGCEASYCSPATTPPTLCDASSGSPLAKQPSPGALFDPARSATHLNAFSTFAAGGAVGPFDPGTTPLGTGQVGVMSSGSSSCGAALGPCVNLGIVAQVSPTSVQDSSNPAVPVNQFVMSNGVDKNVPGFMAACSSKDEPCAASADCCNFGVGSATPLSCDPLSHRCK